MNTPPTQATASTSRPQATNWSRILMAAAALGLILCLALYLYQKSYQRRLAARAAVPWYYADPGEKQEPLSPGSLVKSKGGVWGWTDTHGWVHRGTWGNQDRPAKILRTLEEAHWDMLNALGAGRNDPDEWVDKDFPVNWWKAVEIVPQEQVDRETVALRKMVVILDAREPRAIKEARLQREVEASRDAGRVLQLFYTVVAVSTND